MGGFNFNGGAGNGPDAMEQARQMMGQQSQGQDSRFLGFMRGPENIPRIGPDGQPAIAPDMGQVNRPGLFDHMGEQGGYDPSDKQLDPRLMFALQMLRNGRNR